MAKISTTINLVQEHGYTGLRIAAERGSRKVLSNLGRYINFGQNPITDEWDILVILDACRMDLFEEVVSQHEIQKNLDSISSTYSCASSSHEFMKKCYGSVSESVLSKTHLITANGWENDAIDVSKFYDIDNVWKYHHNKSVGNTPPQPVTDCAVRAYRESNASKYIIHYLQPHAPFVHCSGKYDSVNKTHGGGNSQNIWKKLQKNQFEKDEIWEDYAENLRIVLDHVKILLENMSGNMLITADHANGMGKWGIYGHPGYVPVPIVKRVPYVRAYATDERTHSPEYECDSTRKDINKQEHLQDLGYL
jgi:hypothetical protein